MSNVQKYPCIVNRSGMIPKEYIGIMFNGDCGVYRKETVKALKKFGASKELIRAVKAADGDLAISTILIEADQFDVLVNVFNDTDSRTAVLDYMDELYQSVVSEAKNDFSSMEKDFSKMLSHLGENPDIDAIIKATDEEIDTQTEELVKKMISIHDETGKSVIRKYHEACERKLKKLKEEIQKIEDEQQRLKAVISKIS